MNHPELSHPKTHGHGHALLWLIRQDVDEREESAAVPKGRRWPPPQGRQCTWAPQA